MFALRLLTGVSIMTVYALRHNL